MRTEALLIGLALLTAWDAVAAEKMRFWNTSTRSFIELRLAKPGSTDWGPNQCLNDKDKSVDADERLALIGVEPGHYDVKLVEKSGKSCVLHDVELKQGGPYAFSIGEDELKACQ